MTGKNKKRPNFFALTTGIMVAATLISWLIASGGGSTRIRRITVLGENANTISYVAWIPGNATDEAPAPAVVIWPGRSSNAHQLDMWALEFARQGYVGVTVDWNGNGESDIMSLRGSVTAVMNSVLRLPFVDGDHLAVLGNSAGNSAAVAACLMYPKNVVAYINDVHPFLYGSTPMDAGQIPQLNTLLINAVSDQYVNAYVGGEDAVAAKLTALWELPETVVRGKYYGSAGDGTLRQFIVTNTIHQVSALNARGMAAANEFLSKCLPQPLSAPPGGLVMGWYQLFQVIAYAGIIMFIMAFGNLLYEKVPYFNAIGNAPTPNKGLRGRAFGLNVCIAVVIPLVTFLPVSWLFYNADFLNPLFQSRNLRGIIGWLVTNALITLAMSRISARRAAKRGTAVTAADLGLAGPGGRVQPGLVGRALLLGCITAFTVFAWVALVESVFGINYQIWNILNISAIPANRLFKAIPFILCVMVIMFAANIGMNTSRRLAETGNPSRDMARQVILNVLVSAGAVTLLLLAQYGLGWITRMYIMPQWMNPGGGGSSSGALDFAFGFPLIMGFSAGISTYFYRKTNNIWIGLFVSSIIAGIVGVVGATFITGQAVM